MLNKAVFVDRDGTIIFDYGYIKDPEKVDLLPKAKEALGLLKKSGFMVFIITNQSGVGRGMMTSKDVSMVNQRLMELLSPMTIDGILVCEHSPEDDCNCRKPRTGLVDDIIKRHKIDPASSYAIGDKDSDRDLGRNIGGKGIKLGEHGIKTLWDAALFISSKG